MKIIIVGCGKVGVTLADQLSRDGHELVVIDRNPDRVDGIKDDIDVMGLVGNGASFTMLREAGVKDAGLLIAVTGSDEQNLLCCLIAKRAGCSQAIARVRSPIYQDEIDYLKKELGLAMIINPEYETAQDIARIFQFPSAIKIDTFMNGKVELMHFRITAESPLKGMQISGLREKYGSNVLVSAVTRGDELYIPNGSFVLQENDRVSIMSKRHDAMEFFRKIGLMRNRIENCMIGGGGKIPFYLTQSLLRAGIDVTIIEKDRDRCEELADQLPDATIIHGDATEERLLEEEGLPEAQGFAALTGLDEENILVSLYAKGVSRAKIITKVNRINFASVIKGLDLDVVINPRMVAADRIIRCVRSLKNSENSNVENLYRLENGKAEALEFLIKEKSAVTDRQLQDLQIKPNTLICSIARDGKIFIPSGQSEIKVGDSVVVVLAGYKVSDIREILK